MGNPFKYFKTSPEIIRLACWWNEGRHQRPFSIRQIAYMAHVVPGRLPASDFGPGHETRRLLDTVRWTATTRNHSISIEITPEADSDKERRPFRDTWRFSGAAHALDPRTADVLAPNILKRPSVTRS